MSDTNLLYSPIPKGLLGVLDQHAQGLLANLNCHKLGRINSFDATKQTATVEIVGKISLGGKELDYPLLQDCPVWVAQGGGARLTFPVRKNDSCILFFSDRDIDNWYVSGNSHVPNSYRMHDINDGLVLVGFNPQTAALSSYSTTATEWSYGNTLIGQDGTRIDFKNSTTSLKAILLALTAALKAFKDTRGDTPSTDTVTAITAVETLLATLLK